jgi:hypothetical protein
MAIVTAGRDDRKARTGADGGEENRINADE